MRLRGESRGREEAGPSGVSKDTLRRSLRAQGETTVRRRNLSGEGGMSSSVSSIGGIQGADETVSSLEWENIVERSTTAAPAFTDLHFDPLEERLKRAAAMAEEMRSSHGWPPAELGLDTLTALVTQSGKDKRRSTSLDEMWGENTIEGASHILKLGRKLVKPDGLLSEGELRVKIAGYQLWTLFAGHWKRFRET